MQLIAGGQDSHADREAAIAVFAVIPECQLKIESVVEVGAT